MFNRPLIPILLVGLFALLFWLRQPDSESTVSRTALVMGTLVEVKAYGADRERLEQTINTVFTEMTRLEQLFSTHIPASEISRLSAATEPFLVSRETAELLELGLKIAQLSDGAFELGLGRVKALWNIGGENPSLPDESALQQALQGTGPDALQLEGLQVRKQAAALQVDLGGIAKGYVVDQAVAMLRQAGVHSAAVNAGGDIGLLGDRQGRAWRIGIQHPRRNGEVIATLSLRDRAVVTSGDYERFFERDGIRYHHLFDPQTGRPARRCQSVTVVAEGAATADALATAAFVLGPDAGLDLLEQWPDVEGLLIAADGRRLATSGLEGILEWH